MAEQFEKLCQRAGPERCALAGHGSVKARVNALLARVRRAPIPAPSATPRGRLTYAELLTAFFPELRNNPGPWPDYARDLEAAVDGDRSALATNARLASSARRRVARRRRSRSDVPTARLAKARGHGRRSSLG